MNTVRRSPLMTALCGVASIGFLIAAYTTYVHYAGFGALLCTGASHGHSPCLTVQQSRWSSLGGVPVAVLGLAGYAVILASLRVDGDLGRSVGFGTALTGLLFSLYLTYREVVSIHDLCEWCLGSATCMLILAALTAVRFMRAGDGAALRSPHPQAART